MVLKWVEKLSWIHFNLQGESSIVLGIKIIGTLSDENVDIPDVKNGNRKLIFSFSQCPDSTNSYGRSYNKGIQFRCVRDSGFRNPESTAWNLQSKTVLDSLTWDEARHQTSGCYSWYPGRQRSRCLRSPIVWVDHVTVVNWVFWHWARLKVTLTDCKSKTNKVTAILTFIERLCYSACN